jgi:EAL domain-containing protein (putative c-di-GMP-specific phosphodiesterase class I)
LTTPYLSNGKILADLLKEIHKKNGITTIICDEEERIIYSNTENAETILSLIKNKDISFFIHNVTEESKIEFEGKIYKYYIIVPVKSSYCTILSESGNFITSKDVFLYEAQKRLENNKKVLIILVKLHVTQDTSYLETFETKLTKILSIYREIVFSKLENDYYIIVVPFNEEKELIDLISKLELAILPSTSKKEENAVIAGVSIYPLDGSKLEELIEKAKTKQEIVSSFYEIKEVSNIISIQRLIERAFKEKLFVFHIQPYFETWNLKPVGGEFLARIVDSKNIYTPGFFIDYLEKSDYIYDFEALLIDEAIRIAKKIDNIKDKKITLSINIAPKTIKNYIFIESILKSIKSAKLCNVYISLELTEREIIDEDTLVYLKELKSIVNLEKIPVKITIDDFGSGYTSVKTLTRGVIDSIKIDKSIIDDIYYSKEKVITVSGFSFICGKMGITTIAEGVEEEINLRILRAIGVDQVQGYLLSKPVSPEEFLRIILTVQ